MKSWKPGVCFLEEMPLHLDSGLEGRCVLAMKDFAERGISRRRLRCQSAAFEITPAVTAGWHRGWVGESLENGDAVDIGVRLFVEHSQSQIISSSKHPPYCHTFKHLFGVFIWYAHKEQREACGSEPRFSDYTVRVRAHTRGHLGSN